MYRSTNLLVHNTIPSLPDRERDCALVFHGIISFMRRVVLQCTTRKGSKDPNRSEIIFANITFINIKFTDINYLPIWNLNNIYLHYTSA